MEINITIDRGGIEMINYGPDLMRKIEQVLSEEAKLGETRKNDAYMRMLRLQRELRWAVDQLFPQETEQPYTITIKVEGTADHSPGPRLY